MFVHLEDGSAQGFDADVGEDVEFWVEEFAEAFEEQHVGVEFAVVFVFDAEEEVVEFFFLRVVD